jgi:hypothetical protein
MAAQRSPSALNWRSTIGRKILPPCPSNTECGFGYRDETEVLFVTGTSPPLVRNAPPTPRPVSRRSGTPQWPRMGRIPAAGRSAPGWRGRATVYTSLPAGGSRWELGASRSRLLPLYRTKMATGEFRLSGEQLMAVAPPGDLMIIRRCSSSRLCGRCSLSGRFESPNSGLPGHPIWRR